MRSVNTLCGFRGHFVTQSNVRRSANFFFCKKNFGKNLHEYLTYKAFLQPCLPLFHKPLNLFGYITKNCCESVWELPQQEYYEEWNEEKYYYFSSLFVTRISNLWTHVISGIFRQIFCKFFKQKCAGQAKGTPKRNCCPQINFISSCFSYGLTSNLYSVMCKQ